MPSLLCCRAPRSSSPQLPNVRHVNISDEKQRGLRNQVPTYSISIASSKSAEDLQAIHQIFASSSQDEGGQRALAFQRPIQELHTNTETKIHHKESSSRLQDVTTRLRKRLSRDSTTSRRSSKRRSRTTTSEEDIERRRELKRALHKRLQDEILEDRRVSEGGYDPDAEIIATPSISRETTAGPRVSPRYLGEVLRRLESVRELEKRGRRQSEPGPKADSKTPDVVRRTHTIRSVVTPSRTASKGGPGSAFAIQTREDNEDDLRTNKPTNLLLPLPDLSPVWRSDLRLECLDTARPTSVVVIPLQNSISPATPPQRSDTNDSSRTINAPAAPILPPLRLPSISGSVTARDWRLSLTPGRGNPLSGGDNDVPREKEIEGNKIQSPKARIPLIGTSSFLGPIRSNEIVRRSAEEQKADHDHASRYMPSAGEDEFGGIDDGPESSRTLSQQGIVSADGDPINADRRSRVSSVHLYDMHISQRLASRGLLSNRSSSYRQELPGHQRSMSSCGSSLLFPVKTRHNRQTSSSGLTSLTVPRSWGGIFKDNTSSVYDSKGASLTSSPNSSVIRFPNLSDQIWQSKAFQSRNELPVLDDSAPQVTSASTIPWKSINQKRPRGLTIDTGSLRSSTDSFRAREVAAAEIRILPRPRSATLPKVSRFKEDFEGEPSLEAHSEQARPIQHKLQRRHSIASYDGSDEWYASGKRQGFGYEYVPTGTDTSTVLWERAFQQHAEGGVSSSELRSGSVLQDCSAGGLKSKGQGDKASEVNTALIPAGMGFRTGGWSFESKPEGPAEVPEIDPKHVNRHENPYTSSITSRSSWGRYPSHTRAERSSSPAGEADNVTARDFAPVSEVTLEPGGKTVPKSKRGFSMLGKKKSRSMTFGKAVMKTFSKLYKSHSTDFRPSMGNHRTSVHIGGVLEYPELEVLAPLSPIVLPSQDDCQSDGVIFAPLTACKSNGSQQSIVRRSLYSEPPPRTRTWSRAYDDCVIIPSDTDETSMAEASASSLYPSMASREPVVRGSSYMYPSIAPKEQDVRSWRRPSSNSTANMRASTLDFQRSLQIHEVKARERALQAAEKAWGIKPSP